METEAITSDEVLPKVPFVHVITKPFYVILKHFNGFILAYGNSERKSIVA